MIVGNKIDRNEERAVSRAEGVALARSHGCLFLECSALNRSGVQQAFSELVQRVRLPLSSERRGGVPATLPRTWVRCAQPGG
jgi:hypothetical protein